MDEKKLSPEEIAELLDTGAQDAQSKVDIDLSKLDLKRLLWGAGLFVARIRGAADVQKFAEQYSEITHSVLEAIGFRDAIAEEVPVLLLSPRARIVLGLVAIATIAFVLPTEEG